MMIRFFIAFLAIFFFLSWQQSFASFKDVSEKHAYNEAIEYVQAENIVSGYPDGTYQPDRILNRAEFTKIIIGSRFSAQEIDTCLSTPDFYEQKLFSDVEKGAWFEKYVCMAKKEGIIGGYPDGTFKPENTINFAEAAKITVKSYGLKTSGEKEPWFKPFLEKLEERNAVPRTLKAVSDLTARGGRQLTRGEMADIIFRLKDQQDTVQSSDGSFSLKISEAALPKGVSLTDIKVTKTDPSENPIEEVSGAPMVFYKLEPEGTKFKEPITFQVSVEMRNNSIPLVFLVSGDSFDMIPNPVIALDQKTQIASLSAKLTHFSGVGISINDLFEVSIPLMSDQLVKLSFPVNISIFRTAYSYQYRIKGGDTTLELSPEWGISSGNFLVIKGGLNPMGYLEAPQKVKFSTEAHDFYLTRLFTCENKGSAQIEYNALINWSIVITKNGQEENISRRTFIKTDSNIFECQEGAGTNLNLSYNPGEEDVNCPDASYLSSVDGGKLMPVIKLKNTKCYAFPERQFGEPFDPDKCDKKHYHADYAIQLDGKMDFDPLPGINPPECGFGRLSETELGKIYVHPDQYEELHEKKYFQDEYKEDAAP